MSHLSNNQRNDFSQSWGEQREKESILEYVMQHHMSKIYLLAYSFVKNEAEAEDITQDVFIKCYKNLEGFRGDAEITTWLYRITANTAKNTLRRKKVEKVKYPLKFFGRERHTESTEITYMKQKKKEEVLNIVLELPVKYREVLVLYYFQELYVEEIHEILGENINTIKTRLSRGRSKLKNKLRSMEGVNIDG